jgi:hypothetical protein
MFFYRQNFIKTLKKATVYSVALFIVVFALADVSVLQAYHGNESIGIPPAHHSTQENDCPAELTQTGTDQTNADTPFLTNHNHNSDEDCSGEGECLASCSHIVVGYFVFEPFVYCETTLNQNSLHRENTTPKSELSAIFRPPQIA